LSSDSKHEERGEKANRPKYSPPRLGIWEGDIGCTAKMAIGGLTIDNQLTS
jgi:hypothetical protein